MGKYTTPTPKNKKKNTAIALMALLLMLGAIGFAAAKYVSNYQKEAEIHASNFHFSSDYLAYSTTGSTVPEFTVSNWNRGIQFHLFNYEKENVAQISDSDIVYTITVSKDWTVSVTDSQGNAVSGDGTYTLAQSDACTYHLVTLTYTGESALPKAEVTVTSSSPYSKELKATFVSSSENNITYTVDDMGHYAVVTIYTNQYYGDIAVSWNDTHSPDNTNDLMTDWSNTAGSSTISNAKEFTTYTLIFLENQTHNSGKTDFTINKTGA